MTSFGTVRRLVEGWHPRRCAKERDYELALARYLRSKLKRATIVRQYGLGVTKIDICIDDRVFVEIKRDLVTAGKLQRLIGQMDLYRRHKVQKLVVVLAGRVEERMLKEIERVVRESWSDFLGEREGAVIRIPARRPRRVPIDNAALMRSIEIFTHSMEQLAEKPRTTDSGAGPAEGTGCPS